MSLPPTDPTKIPFWPKPKQSTNQQTSDLQPALEHPEGMVVKAFALPYMYHCPKQGGEVEAFSAETAQPVTIDALT